MERITTKNLLGRTGEEVRVMGWINTIRNHGKIVFLDVRDRDGIIQVVCSKEKAKDLNCEDVIEVEGKIVQRPEKLINPNSITGTVELHVGKMKIIDKAAPLPFAINKKDLGLKLSTLLDYRSLILRNQKVKNIFRVKAQIAKSFRDYLTDKGFIEIFVPTIVASTTEGGAAMFAVNYYDHKAYLSQSPQLYKQVGVSSFERVFTISHSYRAEPSVTTRHLSEYVGLDAEVGFIEDWTELMDLVEDVIKRIFEDLKKLCSEELDSFGVVLPLIKEKIPRISFFRAKEICFERTRIDQRKEPDLSPKEEKEIIKWAKEEKNSEFVFITHYPAKKRPFYTYPDPTDSEVTYSFDLLGQQMEWVTGGQRINNYKQLVENIKKWGYDPKNFELYLQSFRYGMPPEGGFCIGLERLTMCILGLQNIREASLFPRDMQRIDTLLSNKLEKQTREKKSKNNT